MESADSLLQRKGWALKKADVIPQWNKRFLACDPWTCHLLYYRDMPAEIGVTVPRGSLNLTECTVNVTSGNEPEEQQFRFNITSKDRKQTYNLQVGTRKELKSWCESIKLLSMLGSYREWVSRESMEEGKKVTLLLSSQKLLEGLEQKSSECREALKKVAEQKWKAKCRLIELLKQLKKGETVLQDKFSNLQIQEKDLQEKMHYLKKKEFFLQDEVSKSNSIQEKVVEAFYGDEKSLDRRALAALKLCTPGLENSPSSRTSNIDADMIYKTGDKSGHRKQKKLPAACNFSEEMVKILLVHFPGIIPHLSKSFKRRYLKQFDDYKEGQDKVEGKEDLEAGLKLSDTERTLVFFHSYFTKVHVLQEERLIQVRTQCQAKFHKLKWINRQRELMSREGSELRWIISEMKRGISRLTKEGVPLGPGEVDADIEWDHTLRERVIKDTPVPIRAHRATWSEASDVIFKLNFNRLDEYEKTQELEAALTTRESIREFLGTVQSTQEENLETRIRLVEASSYRRDSRRDLAILKKSSSLRCEEDMKE